MSRVCGSNRSLFLRVALLLAFLLGALFPLQAARAQMITYDYDDGTAGAYRIGRLWKVTDLTGSTTFTYDQRGRQTQVDRSFTTEQPPAWGTPETVASTGTVGQYASLKLDSSGNPRIAYYDGTNGDLKYAAWTGSSWSIQTAASTGTVGQWVSLALDGSGNPRISYYDGTNADLKYASWTGSTWSIQTVASTGTVGQYTSLALDSSGNPRISYYDSTNADLKYASWTGSTWSIQTVDSSGTVGQWTSIALDGSGNPHIAYYYSTGADLKYAKWTGTAWSISTVASTGSVGQYTSIKLDSSGNPRISYYDSTNGDLKYAAWNGSSWSIQTVDSTGNVGQYTSLTLDSSGNPHISYYDVTNTNLKYAKWTGTAWSIQTIDSASTVGLWTSLALDSSGNPRIAYYYSTSADLKYAKYAPPPPTVTTYTTQYTYDTLDRVVTMTYPDGEVVNHTYNSQGLLETFSSATYSMSYISNLDYNALDKITYKSFGNGINTWLDYYYGSDNRLRQISTGLVVSVQNLIYEYDSGGNVTAITDTVKAATQSFGYDALDRLTSASSVASPTYSYTYAYSSIGNMTSGAGQSFTYPASGSARPHAPTSDGSCSYSYDNNGNMTTRVCGSTTRAFTWDADNRLTRVQDNGATLAQFTYDYAGTRAKKVEGSNTTVYPFGHYKVVNGTTVTKYYFANGSRVAERVGPAVTDVYYYHPDHLGSSNVVTDSAFAEVKATLFYPYGSTRAESGTKEIIHKYTGKEMDTSTGLYNYGARYYDPAFMHFITADSIIPNAGDPQMLNRYAYVRNNPIRLIDPTGHSPVQVRPGGGGWMVFVPIGGAAGIIVISMEQTVYGAVGFSTSKTPMMVWFPTSIISGPPLEAGFAVRAHVNANFNVDGIQGGGVGMAWYLTENGVTHVARPTVSSKILDFDPSGEPMTGNASISAGYLWDKKESLEKYMQEMEKTVGVTSDSGCGYDPLACTSDFGFRGGTVFSDDQTIQQKLTEELENAAKGIDPPIGCSDKMSNACD